MLVATVTLLLAVTLAGVVRHRQVRRRWVSPYAVFRSAGARVTRTTEHAFEVTGARMTSVS